MNSFAGLHRVRASIFLSVVCVALLSVVVGLFPAGPASAQADDLPVPVTATIGNRVWEDLNSNGRMGPDEPGVAGVQVQVRDSAGNVVDTTTTSRSGYWALEVDSSQSWTVQIDIPDGFQATNQRAGSNTRIDSDADASGVINIPAGALTPGPNNKTFDAGIVNENIVTIGNRVWHDIDGNGRMGPDEPGVAGVLVVVLDTAGNVVDARITGEAGYWTSRVDSTQRWIIGFVAPDGFDYTTPGAGSNSRIDSDADRSGVITIPAGTLTPRTDDKTFDVGLISS